MSKLCHGFPGRQTPTSTRVRGLRQLRHRAWHVCAPRNWVSFAFEVQVLAGTQISSYKPHLGRQALPRHSRAGSHPGRRLPRGCVRSRGGFRVSRRVPAGAARWQQPRSAPAPAFEPARRSGRAALRSVGAGALLARVHGRAPVLWSHGRQTRAQRTCGDLAARHAWDPAARCAGLWARRAPRRAGISRASRLRTRAAAAPLRAACSVRGGVVYVYIYVRHTGIEKSRHLAEQLVVSLPTHTPRACE